MQPATLARGDLRVEQLESAETPAQFSGGSEVDLLRAMRDRVDQHDAAAFNNLGVLYHTRGLHREAVEAFLKALELEPRMRAAANNLEVAARVQGACDDQLEAIERQIEISPYNRSLVRQRARILRLVGRLEAAANQFDILIAQDPDDGAALFERGLVDQRSGDLRRAQRWFERAVNAGANETARLHLAEVLYQLGQNEQALDQADLLLDRSPAFAEAWLLRGFILGDIGHHEQAMESTQRAYTLNPLLEASQRTLSIPAGSETTTPLMAVTPEGVMPHYGLGLAFRQRGYLNEARVEFERAAQHGEDPLLVQHALAELDLISGDSSTATRRMEGLLSQRENSRFWAEHGVARHQAGAIFDAADSYRRALRLDPRNALAYNNLGVALADAGELTAAADAFERASELEPSLIRAVRNRAILHARENEPLVALSLLRELTTFHRDDAEAWFLSGGVLAQLGRTEEARDSFVQSIQLRPQHADARFGLAEVLDRLGDTEGALRETTLALSIAPVRSEPGLTVEIDLQSECPDVAGSLNILRLAKGSPLTGVTIDAESVDSMLKEADAPVGSQTQSDKILSTLGEADEFAERTLYGEAYERYERARVMIEQSDMSSALWRRAALGEARSRCLLHDSSGIRELLKRLNTQLPNDPETWVLMASSLVDEFNTSVVEESREQIQQHSLATDMLSRLLRHPVESAGLLHLAGDIAVRAGSDQLALGLYRRALASDPVRPSPRVAIARILRTQGNLEAARLELTAALVVAHDWRDASFELAMVHRDAGRLSEARSILANCLVRVSTDIEALAELISILIEEERAEDARTALRRLQRHDPENLRGFWFEALLAVRDGRMRDAMARWKMLAKNPESGMIGRWAQDALTRAQHLGTSGGTSTAEQSAGVE